MKVAFIRDTYQLQSCAAKKGLLKSRRQALRRGTTAAKTCMRPSSHGTRKVGRLVGFRWLCGPGEVDEALKKKLEEMLQSAVQKVGVVATLTWKFEHAAAGLQVNEARDKFVGSKQGVDT